MTKRMKKLVVCTLILGLQCGLGLTAVSAAPMNDDRQQISWNAAQQDEIQALTRQEVARHQQAMLQRPNESVSDWEWRQWLEHEQHNQNMQNIQPKTQDLNVTPVNW